MSCRLRRLQVTGTCGLAASVVASPAIDFAARGSDPATFGSRLPGLPELSTATGRRRPAVGRSPRRSATASAPAPTAVSVSPGSATRCGSAGRPRSARPCPSCAVRDGGADGLGLDRMRAQPRRERAASGWRGAGGGSSFSRRFTDFDRYEEGSLFTGHRRRADHRDAGLWTGRAGAALDGAGRPVDFSPIPQEGGGSSPTPFARSGRRVRAPESAGSSRRGRSRARPCSRCGSISSACPTGACRSAQGAAGDGGDG
jgi:hypothetical protein